MLELYISVYSHCTGKSQLLNAVGGGTVFVLSVSLFVVIAITFEPQKDREFIFDMPTPLMMPFQMTPIEH